MSKLFRTALSVACAILSMPALAALDIRLSGSPTSSEIVVNFSGSSTVERETNLLTVGFGWNFTPTSFNPFPSPPIWETGTGRFAFQSGSAILTDTNTGISISMQDIFLRDSTTLPNFELEGFGLLAPAFTPIAGHQYTLSGSGIINIESSGLTFGDFQLGTTGPIFDSPTGLTGQLTIGPIPEPQTLAQLSLGFLTLLVLRSRSAKKKAREAR